MSSTTQDLERKIAWRSDFYDIWRTRGHTIVVAASNSLDPTLADPAYRCDGTADQAEINAAITALGATGGTVILLDGTFAITAPVALASNVALAGQGAGTVLRVPDGHDVNLNVISGSSIDHVLVANLKVDGNKANQTAGTMHGVYFDTVTHSKVVDCWAEDMYGGDGIRLYDSSNYNIMTGNTCQGNGGNGIAFDTANYNIVTGNTCQGNGEHGIRLYNLTTSNTVEGNTVEGNSQNANITYDGIFVDDNSDYNNIQGNTVRQGVGANKQRYGINIAAATCDGNLVINNDIYSAGATANFSDAGTGTVVRNNRGWVTENNVLSPAFSVDAVAVQTVTIPHGLDVTPAPEDCQLTVVEVTDVDDWAEGFVKVESVDATNVVAKVKVTTASPTGGATAKLALHVDLAGG